MRASIAERVTLAAVAAIQAEVERLNAGPPARQVTIKINLGQREDEAYIDYQGSRVKV